MAEKRRPIIGVDLDNTALEYSEALWADIARQDGLDVAKHIAKYTDPTSYDYEGWAGFPEDFMRRHLAAVDAGLYANLVAKADASKYLWKLSDEEYHIRIITARFVGHNRSARIVADTAYSLDAQNIPMRDLVFTSAKTDIYADLYIDDAPKNIIALREKGSRVIIFDAPYNRHLEGERATTWKEAYELITGKLKAD